MRAESMARSSVGPGGYGSRMGGSMASWAQQSMAATHVPGERHALALAQLPALQNAGVAVVAHGTTGVLCMAFYCCHVQACLPVLHQAAQTPAKLVPCQMVSL